MSWLSDFLPSPAATPQVSTDPVITPAVSEIVPAFASAFKALLKYEGGFTDDPRDSGNFINGVCLGTKYGIASASYLDCLSRLSEADRIGMPSTVRSLSIEQAGLIYKARYWSVCRCDELPEPIAAAVFDAAVNSGVGRSIKWLQSVCNTDADGIFGPATMIAVQRAVDTNGAISVAEKAIDTREAFLKGLSTFSIYGHGWLNRTSDVRSRIEAMQS